MVKPIASPAMLRRLVREVLAMAPGYGFADEALCRAVSEMLPVNSATESQILSEAVWNLGNDYVSDAINEDTDLREWKISNHGLAKQSIK